MSVSIARDDPFDYTDSEREEVLGRLIKDGKLTAWPGKPIKRKIIVLSYAAKLFEREHDYTEKEVMAILSRFYEADPFLVRRGLIDCKFLSREKNGSRYWVPDEAVADD